MSDDAVKLGLMPPLSGLVALYGEEIVRAARIACAEVNEQGGVLGRLLQLVIEDDGSLPDSAVAAAERLADHQGCAAIIGNLLSNSRIAVAYRVAEPRKLPYLNFSFYEGSILSRYFFHFAALPNQQIDRMIPWMRKKYGPRMFFAGNNYEWPRGSIDAAKNALMGCGGEVVGEEYCPIGASAETIERLLDHVEASAPDVFVPYFAGADQVALLTRFTERGLKARMAVVMGHFDEMMASQLSPEVRADFYSSNSYFMSVDSVENRSFLARLAALDGVDGIWPRGNGILTNFGEGAYLCVKAFAQAANAAASLDSEALVEALERIVVDGPQGRVQMDPATHHAQVNTCLARCQVDGAFIIVDHFGAIDPVLPARYNHQRIHHQATLEDDIRLQARMLEQMSEAVLLINARDEAIVYANAGADAMFGYDKGGLIGQGLTRLMAAADAPEAAARILRELEQKGRWRGEINQLKRDATTLWCSASFSMFTHPLYGEVWLAVYRDISQLKALQHELEAHRQNLESAVQQRTAELVEREKQLHAAQRIAQLGHWMANLQTGALIWSDEIYRIFGRERPTYQPSYDNFFACVHPDDQALVKASEAQAMQFGWHSVDHRVVHTDGTIRWVHEEAQLERDMNGEPLSLTGTVQDITARKLAEAEILRARDEAERANQAKSAFLSRMSHELRTPLNAILGFGQLLDRAELPGEQADNVQEVLHAGRHLLDLINEVLDLARIESGKFTVSKEPVALQALLADCLALMRPQAETRGIQIAMPVTHCDPQVQADRTRLKQVLLNLLSNAVKYNRADGTVSVSCERLGDDIRINIRDGGPGLSPAQQARLFKPFERLDADSSGIEGTGIGLALSKRLMEVMDGEIGVDSTPGEGSTFWLRLPAADGTANADAPVAAAAATSALPASGQLRFDVLCIEDNPANLRLVERILAYRPAIRLLAAASPSLGLELARAHRPSLILLDINLPEMDGYGVMVCLRENAATRDIPVIAVSANAMPQDLARGQAAGFVDYLTKPLEIGRFLEAVDAVIHA